MYEMGNGNRLYIPAIVRHLPSTYSMARMRPAYVTDTETNPSRALNTKKNSNESAKYNANPVDEKVQNDYMSTYTATSIS